MHAGGDGTNKGNRGHRRTTIVRQGSRHIVAGTSDREAKDRSFTATAWCAVLAHPWTTALVIAAFVLMAIAIRHMIGTEQPPAVAVQQTLPVGAAMPTVVAVKDERSGCTVRLYYDRDRLVSVLPALTKGGEPDCPDA